MGVMTLLGGGSKCSGGEPPDFVVPDTEVGATIFESRERPRLTSSRAMSSKCETSFSPPGSSRTDEAKLEVWEEAAVVNSGGESGTASMTAVATMASRLVWMEESNGRARAGGGGEADGVAIAADDETEMLAGIRSSSAADTVEAEAVKQKTFCDSECVAGGGRQRATATIESQRAAAAAEEADEEEVLAGGAVVVVLWWNCSHGVSASAVRRLDRRD